MTDTEYLSKLISKAYQRLTHDQLILFLTLRNLPSNGSQLELAKRLADHDLHTYDPPTILPIPHHPEFQTKPHVVGDTLNNEVATHLPLELVAEIIDHLGDWELSKAVGLPTDLSVPRSWSRATKLDLAILSGNLQRVQNTPGPFYSVAAKVAIRFSYVSIIDYLHRSHRHYFDRHYGIKGELIPLNASLDGRVEVLEWWKLNVLDEDNYDKDAMDGACQNGHTHILQWWKDSGLYLKYSEAALEHASANGHIAVLEWWKESGLPLKIGRVMELASGAGHVNVLEWWHASEYEFKHDKVPLYHASCSGRVDSLEWWAQSGLQMVFDHDALIGATRYNRPEALEWWDKSGFPIQYRLCDIEEALEDATGGGAEVRAWWEKKGVNFKANFTEWTKFQSLN